MKKIILGIIFFTTISLNAQEKLKEPTFVGEAFIVQTDTSFLDLEEERVQIKTRAGVSVYLTGIGNVKTKIEVPGCCSAASFTPDGDIRLIVRAVDNEADPLSIIQVFKFNIKKKNRWAELSSFGTFSGSSSNNLDYLKFKAEKYGEKSYLLTIKKYKKGAEYGVIVNNPNSLDQRQIIVSTFGIK